MIANRIRSLMQPDTGMQVYDEEEECYRPVRYKDIVILARSLKDYGDVIYNALTAQGIPAYLKSPRDIFRRSRYR